MPIARIGLRPNLEIEINGETLEILKELAFWDSIPHLCPVCLRDGSESQLVFTMRTPTARSGNNAGKNFTYYGMECLGSPSHEVQFSRRGEEKGGGLFIRMPNRKDGKPNWRMAYNTRHDEDEDEDYTQPSPVSPRPSSGEQRLGINGEQRLGDNGNVGLPGFLNASQHKELLRLGHSKGYQTEQELDFHCAALYNNRVSMLTSREAIEYRATLAAI